LPVPRFLVERALANDRRIDELVAGSAFDLPDIALNLVPRGGSGRQPEWQTGTDERIGVEDVELTTESPVVGMRLFRLGLFAVRLVDHGGPPGNDRRPPDAQRPRAIARGRW